MKLKKTKLLAKKQISKLLNQTIDLVNNIDEVHRNDQLQKELINLKETSDELFEFFIKNCQSEMKKNNEIHERNIRKDLQSIEEVIQNVAS